jgi:hypothetical protein
MACVPSIGLRQGDPLSPYLFLFVVDGLSKLIQRAILREELKEFRIYRRAPGISHLLFANDSLMFFKFPSRELSRSTAGTMNFGSKTGNVQFCRGTAQGPAVLFVGL